GGPVNWSHDGSHFHRRDSGVLVSFAGYDCHGLSASLPSVSGLPGATVSQAADTRGVLTNTCAATVQRYTISANLASVPTSSLTGGDNSLGWSANLGDIFGNQSTASGGFNVTRRFWQSSPPSSTQFLLLGPRLFSARNCGTM